MTFTNKVLLSDKGMEVTGSHAGSQRRLFFFLFLSLMLKHIHNAPLT
jgi:hypothetical protein